MLRKRIPAAVILIALTALFTACGDSDDEPAEATAPESETTAAPTGGPGDADPAAIEASVPDLLDLGLICQEPLPGGRLR